MAACGRGATQPTAGMPAGSRLSRPLPHLTKDDVLPAFSHPRSVPGDAIPAGAGPALPVRGTPPQRVVFHLGPTNSGKTHDALAALADAGAIAAAGPGRCADCGVPVAPRFPLCRAGRG